MSFLSFDNGTMGVYQKPMSSEELAARDEKSRHYLQVKTQRLAKCIDNPTIRDLYTDNYYITAVPDDVQFNMYLMHYEQIAHRSFTATPSLNTYDRIINRIMWYYGVDYNHSFNRFHEQVRYNILTMAFVWASDFEEQYCKPGAEDFVKKFVVAWLEGLVDSRHRETNDFTARDSFLDTWTSGSFDLITFNTNQINKMKAITRQLHELPFDNKLLKDPRHFLEDFRNNKLSKETLRTRGPQLALAWLVMHSKHAQTEQGEIDAENVAMWLEEDGMEIDDFPLEKVYWNSQVLDFLNMEIDPSLPDPKKVKPAKQTEESIRKAWLNPQDVFNKIFTKENVNGAGVNMIADLLAGMEI
ncbi:hypothetical protein CC80DRAFT_511495 [Byssothecium circinans]|uniref:Uncharacterized protein n=1 Tax=Byssothecium circinans TaxID=147558 RepID=A0A6A5TBX3_9PLEO|nr:hypothetical protein CC80DRAFT_511495 [Byssothecium circinans]